MEELYNALRNAHKAGDIAAATRLADYIKQTQTTPLFTTPEPEKEQAGFLSAIRESATTLGLADEAAAWAANPTEENRKAFLAAGASKYESAGGFGADKGLAKNWQALKELAGGSLGFLAAPAAAGLVTGGVGAGATLGTQYTIENLKRQAEEQEKAINKGEAPAEVSVGKAAVGAAASTALDIGGMKLLRPLFSKFPGLNKLLGGADDTAVKETGEALEEAIRTGKYEITKGGVFKGVGKGVAIEMPQEIAQQALERWQAGLSLTDEEAREEYKQAAIGAALLGAPMGGAGAALEQRANKALAEKKVSGEREEAALIKADQEALAAEEAERAKEAAYGAKVVQEKQEADEKIRIQQEAAQKDAAETEEIKRMLAEDEQRTAEAEKIKLQQEAAKKDAAETSEIEKMLAEDEAERLQRAQEIETLKAESELETVDLKRDAARQLATENKRRSILIPLIENADPSYAEALPEAFSTALKRAGFKDTALTESEQNLLGRAVGMLTATKPPLEQIPTSPAAAQNQLMEAAATRMRQEQKPGQLSFPGLGRKQITKPTATPATENSTSTPAPFVLTENFLNELNIPKTAPIRRGKSNIAGKDLNKPEVQEALRSYAANEIVLAENKESSVRVKRALDINRMLQKQAGVPETQMDLFAPTPAQKTVTPAPAPVEEAVTPAPVEQTVEQPVEAVAPAPVEQPVKEAVAPAPVEEDVRERPPAVIPIKPLKDEVEVSTPDTAQVSRVGEIMGGDVRATRTDPRHPLYRKGGVEATAYSVHSTPTGVAVHRVTYNDGSVRTVAFNKAGKEISRELTPAPEQKPLALIPSAVINTAMPLNERIVGALKSGNLSEALTVLGVDKQYPNTLRTIARVLGRVVGSTKVEIVEGLTDPEGNPVAGLFDPKTNTVKLDSVTGLNSHVLLHEQTHAAVSAALDNPSHPVTMKLTKLYNEVRPALRNAYGGKNLQDFVAEAFTNPSFQQELSSILTKGTELSAFERLINIVSNFIRGLLGLPHKQQAIRSMDDLNTAILSLMAPAPESRNAGELYMAGFDTATKQIDDAIESVPDIQSKQALSAFELLKKTGTGVYDYVFGHLASLPVLTNAAKKYVPKGAILYKTINLQEGDRKKIREYGEKTVHETRAYFAKDPALTEKRVKQFGVLINFSTLNQVDLRLSGKEAGFKYKDDQTKLDAWDKLKQIYDSSLIGDEGRALYDKVFKTYKWLEQQYKGGIYDQLKGSGASEEIATSIIRKLEEKLREMGVVEPYAKLGRPFGNYWLSYFGVNPITNRKEFITESFSNIFSRNTRIKELEMTEGTTDISPWENIKDSNYRNAPPGSYVYEVIQILEKNNVPQDVQEQVLQGYVNILPDQAYLKSAATRKGTLGFNPDATISLEDAFKAASVHIPTSKYRQVFSKLKTELAKAANTAQQENDPNAEEIVAYTKMFYPHIDFAMNPSVQGWAKIATSVGFNYGLGFNASGYVVNMFALPTFVGPYLAGKYVNNYDSWVTAYTDTSKAVARSMSVFKNGKSLTKLRTGLNAMGLEGYDFSQGGIPASLRIFEQLQKTMKENGQFKLNSAERELDLEGYGPDWFAKFNSFSGWFMSHSEQLLRETTIMTDYQMSLANQLKIPVAKLDAAFASGKITPAMMEKAAEDAIATADLLNTGVLAQMSPRIGQKGIGKVALLFRKYSLNQFGVLLNLVDTSLKGSAEDKRMARTQLAGIFGNSILFAGVGGAPFFGTAALLYNLFKEDDEDDLETVVRKAIDERWYGGLGNYIFGAELSSRIGLSNFVFRESFNASESPYLFQALEQLGGPLMGMILSAGRGMKLIGDGELRRGIELLMPVPLLRNMSKAERFSTEGATTLAGDKIIDPVTAKEALFQLLGFTPAQYIQQLEKNASRYRFQNAMREQRTKLYNRYYKAVKDHDLDAIKQVREDIAEYNRRFPDNPISQKTIAQSMKGKERRSAMNLDGFSPVSKEIRRTFVEEDEEWGSVDSLWSDLFAEEEEE